MIGRRAAAVLAIVGPLVACAAESLPRVEAPALDARDREVVRIVLESVIRPRLVASSQTTAPILLEAATEPRPFIEELPTRIPPLPPPAFRRSDRDDAPYARAAVVRDRDLTRAERLAWAARNLRPLTIGDPGSAGFVVAHGPIPRRTYPTAGLTAPAYADSHDALLYAGFTCGGSCGEGWLIRVIEVEGRWMVASQHMVWIS